MMVKLVKSNTIEPGDKVLWCGKKIVEIKEVIRPYKHHFILVGFDELIFHTDNMKILKVLDD